MIGSVFIISLMYTPESHLCYARNFFEKIMLPGQGLGQARLRPSPSPAWGPGLRFWKAWALPGQSPGFQAKLGLNITTSLTHKHETEVLFGWPTTTTMCTLPHTQGPNENWRVSQLPSPNSVAPKCSNFNSSPPPPLLPTSYFQNVRWKGIQKMQGWFVRCMRWRGLHFPPTPTSTPSGLQLSARGLHHPSPITPSSHTHL